MRGIGFVLAGFLFGIAYASVVERVGVRWKPEENLFQALLGMAALYVIACEPRE